MRFNLLPENRQFYDFIEKAGRNMYEAVRELNDLLGSGQELEQKVERIRAIEKEGDEILHHTMAALNRTFLTPFDREDIAFLSGRLDDVVDLIGSASLRLKIYSLNESTSNAREMSAMVLRQAEIVNGSLGLLRDRKTMRGILDRSKEVQEIENKADDVLCIALGETYNPTPPTIERLILGLKWQEVYTRLEKATDRLEEVMDTLEGIALKYS
jgi:uncharacterized protein Yka (UPF0111/DUF47 family)